MDKPPIPDWATRDAKRQETPKKEPPAQAWLRNLRDYSTDPKGYVTGLQEWIAKQHAATIAGLESGAIIEAGRSDDPDVVKMQQVIDQMAHDSGRLDRAIRG